MHCWNQFVFLLKSLFAPPVSCGKGWTPYDRDCWRILSYVNNSHYSNISTCRYFTHQSQLPNHVSKAALLLQV